MQFQYFSYSTVSVEANLIGTSDISLTTSGTLSGTGALTGQVEAALSVDAELGARPAGYCRLVITASGTLSGTGALASESNLVVTVSGTLIDATAIGELRGTTNLVLTTSSILQDAPDTLSGTSDLIITTSGIMQDAINDLIGSSNLVITTTGILQDRPETLVGTSDLTITTAGTMFGRVKMTGTCQLSITGKGYLRRASTTFSQQIFNMLKQPSYKIDGQDIKWNEHVAALVRYPDKISAIIDATDEPYELTEIGY